MEALRPTAAHPAGPWPTIAGGNVFDSRLDPIDDLAPSTSKPVVVVYTEHDNGDPSQAGGGPDFKRIADLIVEVAVVARVDDGATPGAYEAGVPETDAELEASLDLIEAQVRFALMFGPTGALWRQLTRNRVMEIRSAPQRTSEERVRLAMRTLTMQVRIPDDCYDPAPATAPAGNDRLPEPLRSVIAALAGTAYGKKIGEGLAASAPVHPIATPLKTVAMDIDVANPQGEHLVDDDDNPVNVVSAEADNLDQ